MRTFILLLATLALALSACEADNGEEELDTTEAAVVEALDDVTAACQDRDRDRLEDRLDDELHEQLRDRDRIRLFGSDDATIELVSRTIEVDGDTATVTVVHEISVDGETAEVERIWVFELTDDGDWVLTEIPDCTGDQDRDQDRDQDQDQDRDQERDQDQDNDT